jgi:hypothetical protein
MRVMGMDLRVAVLAISVSGLLVFSRGGTALGADRNACGCYRAEGGSCYCDKKAKCGCPGDCEPKGCEEKRQKEMEKEINEETKRAQNAERSQERSEKSGTAAAPPSKAPSAAKALTPTQLRELARLLDLYVAQHPDESAKSIDELARDLSRPAK